MTPVVSIIMGSTSDLPVMEKAAKFLDEMEIPFEMHALSAHRTPAEVEAFAKGAKVRGIKVIIAAAGMAAHLCGVIASMTTVPVIGVPINSTLDGMDALLAIVQMPPGIPVASVGFFVVFFHTFTLHLYFFFPILAVITAVPGFWAVTFPFLVTVAIVFLLLDHFTFFFVPFTFKV